MASKWLGYSVSIDCGDVLGCYQGKVCSVNEAEQTITLTKVFRDGVECKVPEVTICAQDIQELKILKKNSADQLENLNSPYSIEKLLGLSQLEEPNLQFSDRKRTQSNSESRRKPTTPKKLDIRRKWQERDEACFSAPIDSFILENDFDFEKNLALFDKRAVFEEINASSKPDVVRLVDSNRKPTAKYRCDENILDQEPVVYRQIIASMPDKKEYVTDAGLIVPSIQPVLRMKLFATAEKFDLTIPRQLDMIGRAASDMVVQLLGGSHRLSPQNIHQKPVVVILCGAHFQGLQGINCGRHLSNHGANVLLFLPSNLKLTPVAVSELNLFKLSDGRHINNIKDLPNVVVDIIISAVDDHTQLSKDQPWLRATVNWANQCRTPVLALDPPPEGASIIPKWSIVPALPLALESAGAVYLCDVGIPRKVFSEVGIHYSSPFGPKFLIPLHKKEG